MRYPSRAQPARCVQAWVYVHTQVNKHGYIYFWWIYLCVHICRHKIAHISYLHVRCADRRALFVSKWHFRRRPWPLRVSWNPWRPRTSWLYPYHVRAHTPLCSQSMLATPNALPITLASSSRLHPDAHHTGYQGKKGRDAKRLPASQCGMQVPLACIRAPLHVYDLYH